MSNQTAVPEPPARDPFPSLHERGVLLAKYVRRVRALFGGDDAVSLLIAAIIGTLTGFGALGFRHLVDAVSRGTFGSDSVLTGAASLAWPVRLALPVVGLVAAWSLTRWFAKEAKGHGVPEVMDAVVHSRGRIRPRVVLVKAVASAMTIGTGGSVGREGPIVQIGSAIGSSLAQLLKRDDVRTRLFLACGAAAGIAATFNAPISGVVFSIEIILGTASIRTFSPIVVSAVMATTVSRWFLGEQAAFRVPAYALKSPGELVTYLVLGLAAGVLSVVFIRVLYGLEDLFDRLPGPGVLAPILGGVLVGGLGLWVPQIYGLGYEAIEAELHGQMLLGALVGMLVAKVLATSLTLAGGGSGGVFAPSLFLGAMLGGAMGNLANQAQLWATASPGAYALVGMAAVVAATTHAPLTAVIIIFELTGSYEVILPLMLASIIASVVSVLLQRDSIYTMKLSRRGTNINESPAAAELRATPVKELVSDALSVMSIDQHFDRVVERILSQDIGQHYVVDGQGRLVGTILLGDVKGLLAEESLRGVVTAHDMMRDDIPTVTLGDVVGTCLVRFAEVPQATELPVVDGQRVLKGVIRHQDIFRLYNRKLLRTDDLGVMFVTKEDKSNEHDYVELPAGHGVRAVEVPAAFVGKTLADLSLREQHGLLVVGVRQQRSGSRECVAPDPHVPIQAGTLLVLEGPKRELDWLSSL